MSLRTIIIVMLAMSGSFATILALMGYAFGPDPEGRVRRSRRDVVTVLPPSPEPETAREAPGGGRRRPAGATGPRMPVSASAAELSGAKARTDPGVERMAKLSSRRLAGVETALNKQVAALKKSRDEMLEEFSGQLATMTVDAAAAEVTALDDETASLALQRLAAARRKAILRQLPEDRRNAIEKRLTGAATR